MILKAFLILHLTVAGFPIGTVEITGEDQGTVSTITDCRIDAEELYSKAFGTPNATTRTMVTAQHLAFKRFGPDIGAVELVRIQGVCKDVSGLYEEL